MIVLAELADQARITVPELRARLDHAGIGASGHGEGWAARARALADQIRTENQGMVPGGVVGPHAANDDVKIVAAERALHERLQRAFAEYPLGNLKSGAELEEIRNTPFRVWSDRAGQTGPAGEYLGHGFRLFVAIPPGSHPKAVEVIEGLPDLFDGFEVYATDWPAE